MTADITITVTYPALTRSGWWTGVGGRSVEENPSIRQETR